MLSKVIKHFYIKRAKTYKYIKYPKLLIKRFYQIISHLYQVPIIQRKIFKANQTPTNRYYYFCVYSATLQI